MSIFTGLLGGLLGAAGQRSANRASIELANTAYQRAMRDMKTAGLNPILAGKLGGAAVPNIGNVGAAGAQAQLQGAQAANAKEQATLARANVEFTNATGLSMSNAPDPIKYAYAAWKAGDKVGKWMPKNADVQLNSGKSLSEAMKMQKTGSGRLRVFGNRLVKDLGMPSGAADYFFGVK